MPLPRRQPARASVFGLPGTVLAVVLLLAVVLPAVSAQTTLPIVWGSVPTSSSTPAVPRGCSCFSSDSPCTQFDCTCVCDLTAGSCDANCCCDSECSSAEIARFTAANACLPTGPKPSTTKYCADLTKEALFGSINPKFRMVEVKQDSVVDDLMCVAVDNNPSKGSFFTDTGTGDVALLDAATGIYTFKSAARTTSVSTSTLYEIGDTVGAAELSGGSLVSSGGGKLFVPRAGDSGACVDSYTVPFDTDVASSTCTRLLTGTNAERCSSLDYSSYVSNLRVAKAPNSVVGDTGTYVSVTVTSAQLRDSAGTLSAHPNTAALGTTFGNDWCYNAVVQVAYTLTHDGAGHVTAAAATLIVTNATVAGTRNAFQQTFSVTWASSASVTTTLASGNVIARDMSGNPGYIYGKPVLAGVLTTDPAGSGKTAITAWSDGLMLGDCSAQPTVGVSFGDSMTYGCTVTLTEAQLQTLCGDKAAQVARFGFTPTHVGSFGNADPLQTADWVEVQKAATSTLSPTWEAPTRSCTGIGAGLNAEFLTGQVGEAGNPQNKVLAARATYAADTWTFTSRSSTQKFAVRSTVSFVPKESTDTAEYVPPGPPVLPELPNDLFYPFTLSTSGASSSRRSMLSTVAAVGAACVLAAVMALQQLAH